jgi:hypothetical protein
MNNSQEPHPDLILRCIGELHASAKNYLQAIPSSGFQTPVGLDWHIRQDLGNSLQALRWLCQEHKRSK